MHNVVFKDKSTLDFSLVTKDIGRRKKAEEKIERIPIPFRSGDLVVHTGEYESYERQMTFASLDDRELSDIYEWLDGYGKLRTGQDEGGFFYASIIGEIDRTPIGPLLNELTITFLVEPFFYLDSGEQVINLTKSSTLINQGTRESEPYIKVYGTGDITLEVNSQAVQLTGVENNIVMDTKRLICYRDTLNMGRKMTGDYITFDKGENNIKWTGNVGKVEIVSRWCDK